MPLFAAPILASAVAMLTLASPGGGAAAHFLHLMVTFGLFGLFLVSIVDSSFVPLPVPGITDIMLVLYAAQHSNPFMLVALATVGSALGGWFSYRVGQAGGMSFIEKRTPPRIFKRVTGWMESHAVLAVAVPAVLPPPAPLSPFVLAAGALKMTFRKFMIAFTASRCVRHTIAVLLGIHYGKTVLALWSKFSARWGLTLLIAVWVIIGASLAFAFWQIWKTSHSVGAIKARKAAAA